MPAPAAAAHAPVLGLPVPADRDRRVTNTPLRYEVDLSWRPQHLVRVRLHVPADLAGNRLVFPTWTPGSYVMRDYVHHLQQLRVLDVDGNEVPVTPDSHTTFEVGDVDGELVVEYELYANELTVRTNHVDDHHALLVSPATFLLVEGGRDRPHEVTILGDDPVWSLLPDADEPGVFVAEDADHLVDSAFEVGDHPHTTVEVHGVEHDIVWAGHAGEFDLERVADDVRAIVSAAVDLFDGDLPAPFYRFLVTAWNSGGGGLEHRDGSVLMIPSTTFGDPDDVRTLQSLIAHEYLHLWNVKRLVPAELVRPDPVRHTHTRALWIAEGWTSYYDELLPVRAGLWDIPTYLKKLSSVANAVLERPGARLQSVADASWHAWTGLYVRDENSVNAGVNYYSHGGLVAWCLDLLIRRHVPGGDGLDAAFRLLWERHAGSDKGYTADDVVRAVNDAAGEDLQWFFDEHVDGTGLPDLDDLVGVVGLKIEQRSPSTPTPDLGVQFSDDDRGPTIDVVYRDGPAWHGGVTGGDRLVAVNGHVVERGKLAKVLREHQPGDDVDLAVVRGPRLLHLHVVLGEPSMTRRLAVDQDADHAAREAFRRWTGTAFPES